MNCIKKALQDAAKAIWKAIKIVAKVLINYTPTPSVMVIDTCEPVCVAGVPCEVQERAELPPQEYVKLSWIERSAYDDYMARKYKHEENMLKLAMQGGCL